MYDYLVLPEFNESPDYDLGYDNSNVANAFPDQLTQTEIHQPAPSLFATASSTPTVNTTDLLSSSALSSDPYYTYDMMFPSMLSPSMSSESTSPTVPSSDSLFDQAYDFDLDTDKNDMNGVMETKTQTQGQSVNQNQNGSSGVNQNGPSGVIPDPLDSLMSMPLHRPIHMSPMQTSPIACQPTPVHSRSQSYSLPFEGHVQSNQSNHTHHSPGCSPDYSPDLSHHHNPDHYAEVCDSPDSDSPSEELSLDDSPSAHGVLFKNLTQDEQTKYRKYHCPVCKKYFRRDLPRHLRIHQRVARFVCPYPRDQCSHKRGQFNRPYDYKKHLLHSHFQFDEAKLVRGFRDLKSKLSHHGTCNCGRRFRAEVA